MKPTAEWPLKECMYNLLDKKFEPNVRDTYNRSTLLDLCRKDFKLESLAFLLCGGADPNFPNDTGSSIMGQTIHVGYIAKFSEM